MSLADRILAALKLTRVTEAPRPPIEDEPARYYGYRAAGADARPFSNLTFPEMLEKAWTLYTTNPLANRIINIRVEHIVDHTTAPVADNPLVQEVLDNFWYDPLNDMPRFLTQAATQLLIFGTQVFPVFVDLRRSQRGQIGTGLVRLGYLDPADITDINLDPTNVRVPYSALTKTTRTDDGGYTTQAQLLRLIHPDLLPTSPTRGLLMTTSTTEDGREQDETGTFYDGGAALFRINNLMNSKWGWSDLLPLQTWLDQANLFFTDIVQHIYWLTQFVWDVQVEGATEAMLAARRNEIRANPPSRGSVLLHNESEQWKAVTPDLRQEDISSASRTLVWWIAGIGAGIPEHWLGWGRETTRATAREMQSPTLHMLESRQDAIRAMATTLCRFQIDQAIRARILPRDVNTAFSIRLPDLLPPDLLTITTGLRQLTQALSTPAAQNHLSDAAVNRLLTLISKELAIELTNPSTKNLEPPTAAPLQL